MRKLLKQSPAVTLIELLVVVLIIGILATIATGVYTGETRRARVAATQNLIRNLELAITRYDVDLGSLPPSGSGDEVPPPDLSLATLDGREDGSGYLYLALVHSLGGNALEPLSPLWSGPYISFQPDQIGEAQETAFPDSVGAINILDPWGNPIVYVKSEDYELRSDDNQFNGGTRLNNGALLNNQNTDLPAPNPFVALGETHYNENSYQIYSLGPNGETITSGINFRGTEFDDINNFGY